MTTPARPPRTAALTELPLGAVRPAGWLLDQLRLQAEGQTGRLPEVWPDVGPDSAWLGGTGEDWERGPYYADGLVPLAHLLQDPQLLAAATTWVEAILAGQQPSGQFGPATNDDWWPRMVALKVLTQHADATGDARVPRFLERYFRYQAAELPGRPLRSWGRARGAENVLSVLWLHERTGDDALLDLARLLLDQTDDWQHALTDGLTGEITRSFSHLRHGPNVAMGLKTAAVRSLVDGGPGAQDATRAAFDALDREHGLVHGVFSGDEWLAGRDPHHGVETCQVVELMFTLEQLVRILGDGGHADRLELAAFNLLAAANDPRMLAHQYHQQANQVLVSVARRDWSYSGDDANVFGLEPHYGCCTANLHQGWPKFARSLWMGTDDGGLAAVSYAPCQVTAPVGSGPDRRELRLDVRTAYPFEELVRIEVTVPGGGEVTAPLHLRVPAWADGATLQVPGSDGQAPAELQLAPDENGFTTLARTWRTGDVVELTLGMRPRLVQRDGGAVGVRLGPLVLALAVREAWWPVPGAPGLGEWQVTPRSSWNFGLWTDDPGGAAAWRVERHGVGSPPFDPARRPVVVHALGARLPQWRLHDASAGPLPAGPVVAELPLEDVQLVPYGTARLRIAELPVVKPAADPGPV